MILHIYKSLILKYLYIKFYFKDVICRLFSNTFMLQNSNLYAIMECWKILFTFYQILLYKVPKTKLGGHNRNKSGLEAYYKVLKSFQHASSKWCLQNRQVLVDLMKLSEIFYLGYGLFTICISLGQKIHYISLWN